MSLPVRRSADTLQLSPADLMTPDQVAAALGLSHRTLAAWRSTRRHPLPYVKVGNRIRYHRQDVNAWIASQTQGRNLATEGAEQ